jgi:hypothetical protein
MRDGRYLNMEEGVTLIQHYRSWGNSAPGKRDDVGATRNGDELT